MLTTHADLIALDRSIAEDSFVDFMEMAWPVIDPEPFEYNWHMSALADHLVACHNDEITRLLINVPPGTSKSSATAVFFPAWLWGPAAAPHTRFIGASHERDNAIRDNRRTRLLVESQWFRERWPIQMASDENLKTRFENTRGGFRQAAAVASMTGKRGHYVLWDDPQNPQGSDSDLQRDGAIKIFSETLTSRLVNPRKSKIIIIMQRLHEGDVSGHILAKELGYEHLMLPMEFEPERRCYTSVKPSHMKAELIEARYDGEKQIWYPVGCPLPEDRAATIERKPVQLVYNQDPRQHDGELLFEDRFPREVVDRDGKAMGAYGRAGQQQQRPVPREGGLFQRKWFRILQPHEVPKCIMWVRAWDLAATNDPNAAYTAGVLMGVTASPHDDDREFVIADVVREQLSPAGVKNLIKATARRDAKQFGMHLLGSIPKDPGAGGKAWSQALITATAGFNYRASPETGDKMTRAAPVSAQAENGNVILVKGDWNAAFLDEAGTFGPTSKFKDQIDATSRAFMELADPQPRAVVGTY